MAGQATAASQLPADGKPTVEEYPMEMFNSNLQDSLIDPVQPSNNPSMHRATEGFEDEDDADQEKGKSAAMIQKAVSANGNSSDSFVSIDSQDLSQ